MFPLWARLKTLKTAFTRSCTEKWAEAKELLLLGDFNARVGSDQQNERKWTMTFGALLHAQSVHNQHLIWRQAATSCFMETFSVPKIIVPAWSIVVITGRRSLPNVLSTRSYHSAECDSDHALVCNQKTPRINTAGTSDSKHQRKFLSEVEKALEYPQGQHAISRWNFMGEAIHSSATVQSASR